MPHTAATARKHQLVTVLGESAAAQQRASRRRLQQVATRESALKRGEAEANGIAASANFSEAAANLAAALAA